MSDFGCPYCDGAKPGRCHHCRVVRFALPRTREKDALTSPSMGEERCATCHRYHGIGGVYYVLARSEEEYRSTRDREIDRILAEDARRTTR